MQSRRNMSRRYYKRVVYCLVFAFLSILFYFSLYAARMPSKTKWEDEVKVMNIEDEDTGDEYDDYDEKVLALKDKVDVTEEDKEKHQNNEMEERLENNDEEIEKYEDKEHEQKKIDDHKIELRTKENKAVDGHKSSNNNETIIESTNKDLHRNIKYKKKLREIYTIPPEFIKKNEQGQIIEVKHFPNGIDDIINLQRNKNKEGANERKYPMNNENMLPQIARPNNNEILSSKERQNFQRWQNQQARFAAKPPGKNNVELNNNNNNNNNFKNGVNEEWNARNKLEIKSNEARKERAGFKSFDEYLKEKHGNRFGIGNNQENLRNQFRQNNRNQDIWDRNGPLNNAQLPKVNAEIDDLNEAKDQNAVHDINPFFRDRKLVPENLNMRNNVKNPFVGANNKQQNINPFFHKNNAAREDTNPLALGNNEIQNINPFFRKNNDEQQDINLLPLGNNELQNRNPFFRKNNDEQQDINQLPLGNNELQNRNPFFRKNNDEQQDINQLPLGNNELQNRNPFFRKNNKLHGEVEQNPRDNNEIPDINKFFRGRNIQKNPDGAQDQQIDVENQDNNFEEDQARYKSFEPDLQQQNKQINKPMQEVMQRPQQLNDTNLFNENKDILPQDHLVIKDLSAPVKIQVKCVDFTFPTGSGHLCIHNSSKDSGVSAIIEASHSYEAEILNQILFILSNDTGLGFIDIGAGLGVFTIAAALMKRNVLAVEPFFKNCELLHKSAVENHVSSRIVLVSQALAKKPFVGFTKFSDSTGGYSGVQISPLTTDIDTLNLPQDVNIVQVTTLNNLIQVAPFKRALMKLDVGGAMERDIMDASSDFFAAINVPYIITHWTLNENRLDQLKMMEHLLKLGYIPKLTWNGPFLKFDSLQTDHTFLVWVK